MTRWSTTRTEDLQIQFQCQLVCHRRDIMAKQIKLRRNQQRARLLGEGRESIDSNTDSSSCGLFLKEEKSKKWVQKVLNWLEVLLLKLYPLYHQDHFFNQCLWDLYPCPSCQDFLLRYFFINNINREVQIHFPVRMPTMSTMFLQNLASLNNFLQSNPTMVDMFFNFMNQYQQQWGPERNHRKISFLAIQKSRLVPYFTRYREVIWVRCLAPVVNGQVAKLRHSLFPVYFF